MILISRGVFLLFAVFVEKPSFDYIALLHNSAYFHYCINPQRAVPFPSYFDQSRLSLLLIYDIMIFKGPVILRFHTITIVTI